MGNFVKGMNTIGQLCPSPCRYTEYPTLYTTWNSVAESFKQTGDNIRKAVEESNNAKRENKQTP